MNGPLSQKFFFKDRQLCGTDGHFKPNSFDPIPLNCNFTVTFLKVSNVRFVFVIANSSFGNNVILNSLNRHYFKGQMYFNGKSFFVIW